MKAFQRSLWGLVLLLMAAPAHAFEQNWAEKMFEKTNHDFGTVARGSDTRYRLKITNVYAPNVHIASVQTSCGCTAAQPSKDTLVSHESAYLDIVMNTVKFEHDKHSAVTVVFDQPQHAEVRIPIHAYISTDLVLSTGRLEFGAVPQGTPQTRQVAISYAGRADWTMQAAPANKNAPVDVKLVETYRQGNQVRYDLQVMVKPDAPVGAMHEQIMLTTNDPTRPAIPVTVEGHVDPEFTVTPGNVTIGNLTPGQKRTVKVVVRGQKPFSIEKLEAGETAATLDMSAPADTKMVHVLPITIVAPMTPGSLKEEVTVRIAGKPEPVKFTISGKVTEANPTTAAK